MSSIDEKVEKVKKFNHLVFGNKDIILEKELFNNLSTGRFNFSVYGVDGKRRTLEYCFSSDGSIHCYMPLVIDPNCLIHPSVGITPDHICIFQKFHSLTDILKEAYSNGQDNSVNTHYYSFMSNNCYFKIIMNDNQQFEYEFTFFPKGKDITNLYYYFDKKPYNPTLKVYYKNNILSGDYLDLCLFNINKSFSLELNDFNETTYVKEMIELIKL